MVEAYRRNIRKINVRVKKDGKSAHFANGLQILTRNSVDNANYHIRDGFAFAKTPIPLRFRGFGGMPVDFADAFLMVGPAGFEPTTS